MWCSHTESLPKLRSEVGQLSQCCSCVTSKIKSVSNCCVVDDERQSNKSALPKVLAATARQLREMGMHYHTAFHPFGSIPLLNLAKSVTMQLRTLEVDHAFNHTDTVHTEISGAA